MLSDYFAAVQLLRSYSMGRPSTRNDRSSDRLDGPALRWATSANLLSGLRRDPCARKSSAFRDGRVLLMPLEENWRLQLGDRVIAAPAAGAHRRRTAILGRVLDGFGEPMDNGPAGVAGSFLRPVLPLARPARSRAHH